MVDRVLILIICGCVKAAKELSSVEWDEVVFELVSCG